MWLVQHFGRVRFATSGRAHLVAVEPAPHLLAPGAQVPAPAPLIALLGAAPPDAWAWHAPDGSRTFGEAFDRSRKLASALHRHIAARSAGPGSQEAPAALPVVAILGENSGRYIECLYGIPAAGCQALLLNYRHHPAEWIAMLARTECDVVIGDERLLRDLRSAIPTNSHSLTLVAFDPTTETVGDPYIDYEAFIANAPLGAPAPLVDAPPMSNAWLVPTSGTTGTPKLAMLSHRSLQVAAFGCHSARPVLVDDIYFFPFPLCHVAAYNVIVYHQCARPIVLVTRFDPTEAVQIIEQYGVTAASFAPTMISSIIDHPNLLDDRALASLRTVGYGSSAIAEPLLRRAMVALGCGFSQGYGMTELSGNAVFLDAQDHRAGVDGQPRRLQQAGKPTDLIELRIVDDSGHEVSRGVVGEISCRGEQVMSGYYNDPEATNSAIVDGWLRTGDLGTLDADGYLTVVDRKKDIIISGGENVASREVEAVLFQHPAVREAAVIGIPDERWGEVVAAVVVLHNATSATDTELIALCRGHLAGFKQPRRILFLDELPKNTTGKIEKHRLRAIFDEIAT